MDRGQRLQAESLGKTASYFELSLDVDAGMWVSDDDEDIAISPDAAEADTDKPTYAAESKSLDSANHLKYVILDRRAKAKEGYKAIDYIPKDHREQVIQYFVVNEHLQRLYFTLYDDRIALDGLDHHVIVIERKDVETEIAEQKQMQLETLKEINQLIAELAKG